MLTVWTINVFFQFFATSICTVDQNPTKSKISLCIASLKKKERKRKESLWVTQIWDNHEMFLFCSWRDADLNCQLVGREEFSCHYKTLPYDLYRAIFDQAKRCRWARLRWWVIQPRFERYQLFWHFVALRWSNWCLHPSPSSASARGSRLSGLPQPHRCRCVNRLCYTCSARTARSCVCHVSIT